MTFKMYLDIQKIKNLKSRTKSSFYVILLLAVYSMISYFIFRKSIMN